MPYNLAEAGAATGKSKSTILRAIQKGLISAQREQPGGGWVIEPSELHRVFQPATDDASRGGGATAATGGNGEWRQLQARFDDAQATITDLRRRLDTEAEERRTAQAQLGAVQERLVAANEKITALLTDQRAAGPAEKLQISNPAPPAAPARRWWWRR